MADISKHNVNDFRAIYDYFHKVGMPDNGIFGLIGNLHVESCLRSNNLQNGYNTKFGMTDEEYTNAVDNGTYADFANDKAGYGLAQWTSNGRKQGLLNFLKSSGVSIGDLQGQIEYLHYELRTAYKAVYNVLMDKNSTIDECAKIVMLKFERPKNQSEENQQTRCNYAREYQKKYASGNYVMTAKELIEKLQKLLTVPTLYVYGGLGGAMHSRNLTRYKGQYQSKPNINGNMFGFDCVGMIKSLLWGFAFSTDTKYNYGGACVPSNNVPNTGARKFFNDYCKNISDDWSNVVPGEAVWLNGNPDSHIGIYVGNGQVIECSPKWENGVQISYVANMGCKTGHCRTWLKHGFIPWIDYSSTISIKPLEKASTATEDHSKQPMCYTVVKGDTLIKIAKKFGKDYKELAKKNNISNPSLIRVGQKIYID